MIKDMKTKNYKILIKIIFLLIVVLSVIGIANKVSAALEIDNPYADGGKIVFQSGSRTGETYRIPYAEAQTNQNLFCINKGQNYGNGRGGIFNNRVSFGIENGELTLGGNPTGVENIKALAKLNKTKDRIETIATNKNQIAYIFAEATMNKKAIPSNPSGAMDNFYQVGIWFFAGNEPEARALFAKYPGVEKLINNAYAYDAFVKALKNREIDNTKVSINKEKAVMQENGTYGPFIVNNNEFVYGPASAEGKYGEITEINAVGCEAVTNWTFHNDLSSFGVQGAGTVFYVKPTGNIEKTTISIKINNQYRQAQVDIFENSVSAVRPGGVNDTNAGASQRYQNIMIGAGRGSLGAAEVEFEFLIPFNFNLIKTEPSGKEVAGVKFRVAFTNVESIETPKNGKANGNNEIVFEEITTNAKGQFGFTGIKIADVSKAVEVTIEEISAPNGYKTIQGKIEFKIKREAGKLVVTEIKSGNVTDKEFKPENITVKNDEIALNINNIPIINLGGKVWIDGQIDGLKETEKPNGIVDPGEARVEGVRVRLYNSNGQVKKDAYGKNIENVKTNSNGEYKFENIEGGTDYYVVFEYDGINYETKKWNDSKAEEVLRSEFNSKFTSIFGNGAIKDSKTTVGSSNGYANGLEYEHKENTSVLKTTSPLTKEVEENGTKRLVMGDVIEKYRMYAKAGNYLPAQSTTNSYMEINMGLLKREADLSLVTDLAEAEVRINGKSTKYPYNEMAVDANGNLEVLAKLGEESSKHTGEYNLYLYTSDYNFRINDYITNGIENSMDVLSDQDAADIRAQSEELRVFATYKVAINNQTAYGNIRVDELVNYFDKNYTYVEGSAKYEQDGNVIGTASVNLEGTVQIDNSEYNKMTISLTESGKNTAKYLGDGGQQFVSLTFEVNKKDREVVLGTYQSISEITKYSSADGLVDRDSAPANMLVGNAGNYSGLRTEDDMDEARGFKVSVEKTRTLSGMVWEDSKTASVRGQYEDGEKKVNDVTVQLIEVIDIATNGKQYEYIWQETTTGPEGILEVLVNNGNGTDKKAKLVTEAGEYKFEDFIPGNYIVRFIYGDGTSEDVKLYNGQDYKSTIKADYKQTALDYKNNVDVRKNDAVDNEARRLEVMSKTIEINKEIGEKLRDRANLQDTWMCAETPRMDIPVDYVVEQVENGGTVSSYDVKNIDFGLELRPEAKLQLEKHIESLKITAEAGTLLDTANDQKQNLAVLMGNRVNRGVWDFSTDIDELIKGANLEVKYTYTIKNAGDVDYLSKDLVGEFQKGISSYVDHLEKSAKTVKANTKSKVHNIGTYLGEAYYTGTAGANDAEVVSIVNEVQESINNKLTFNESVGNNDFTKANSGEAVSKYVYDTEGNKVEEKINTVVKTKEATGIMAVGAKETRSILLTKAINGDKNDLTYDSYIAEIMSYSNAAGRKDMASVPGNLSYVHSEDTAKTMERDNEPDESWAERVNIKTPTGGTEASSANIMIITTLVASIAIVGAGIILIKKYVIKK